MPTLESITLWIANNLLDSDAWDKSEKKQLAITQATRNLTNWYPEVILNDEHVSHQTVWEIQGLDPALKYQKQGVRAVSDAGERIDYLERSKVSPEVYDLIGAPAFELVDSESPLQFGGYLL